MAGSLASARCSPDTRRQTGSARGAGGSPPTRVPTASSNYRRVTSWTGWPISCRHRGSIGTGITGFSPRITSSGPPSRRMTKGNVGKPRDAATGGHAARGHAARGDATGDRCDSCDKPRSHDTSRIAWAKLMARVGEEFPLECPGCGGDIRLIAFITDPGPIRKILTHLGEPLEPPPVSPARLSRPWPTDRLGRARAGPQRMRRDSDVARRTARDRHSQPLTGSHATVRTAREKGGFKAGSSRREKSGLERG